jgi:hypothetical protein
VRLHPAVTEAEALAWLKDQVAALALPALPPDLDQELASTAEAMATISRTVLPDEQEPRFP